MSLSKIKNEKIQVSEGEKYQIFTIKNCENDKKSVEMWWKMYVPQKSEEYDNFKQLYYSR